MQRITEKVCYLIYNSIIVFIKNIIFEYITLTNGYLTWFFVIMNAAHTIVHKLLTPVYLFINITNTDITVHKQIHDAYKTVHKNHDTSITVHKTLSM